MAGSWKDDELTPLKSANGEHRRCRFLSFWCGARHSVSARHPPPPHGTLQTTNPLVLPATLSCRFAGTPDLENPPSSSSSASLAVPGSPVAESTLCGFPSSVRLSRTLAVALHARWRRVCIRIAMDGGNAAQPPSTSHASPRLVAFSARLRWRVKPCHKYTLVAAVTRVVKLRSMAGKLTVGGLAFACGIRCPAAPPGFIGIAHSEVVGLPVGGVGRGTFSPAQPWAARPQHRALNPAPDGPPRAMRCRSSRARRTASPRPA